MAGTKGNVDMSFMVISVVWGLTSEAMTEGRNYVLIMIFNLIVFDWFLSFGVEIY